MGTERERGTVQSARRVHQSLRPLRRDEALLCRLDPSGPDTFGRRLIQLLTSVPMPGGNDVRRRRRYVAP